MTYNLEKAEYHKAAFISLFNIYAHELSEYENELGENINEKGNYLSDETIDMYCGGLDIISTYVIVAGNRPVGFVAFEAENDKGTMFYSIEECFVIRTERKKGIMEQICMDYWKDKSGVFTICVLKDNAAAIKYWESLFAKHGYKFKKQPKGDNLIRYDFDL